jgi:hypothetical protein
MSRIGAIDKLDRYLLVQIKRLCQQWPRVARALCLIFVLMPVWVAALTMLVFQPGYMTADARYLYDDSTNWDFNDWQSTVMGLLWWGYRPCCAPRLEMFLLVAALNWLGFGALETNGRSSIDA